jgi:hypothetical protein
MRAPVVAVQRRHLREAAGWIDAGKTIATAVLSVVAVG